MSSSQTYPIGTPGKRWGESEKSEWLAAQSRKRQYADEVVAKIEALRDRYEIDCYGKLPVDPDRYPLYVLKTRPWQPSLPAVLITGGVHGYETSGVQGALRFLATEAMDHAQHFNFVVMPCVSPWAYETINRWSPKAVDPNRSFAANSPSEEAAAVIDQLEALSVSFIAHFDLHETTDSDNTEFRPARAARDAIDDEVWEIPDGFYAVGDSARPEPAFQKAVIDSVARVTHIAQAVDGKIIGETLEQFGVINYDAGPLGLCMGVTSAPYVTTTEVYPDSPRASDEICILAQVAAIRGGLEYLLGQRG